MQLPTSKCFCSRVWIASPGSENWKGIEECAFLWFKLYAVKQQRLRRANELFFPPLLLDNLAELGRVNAVNSFFFFFLNVDLDRCHFLFLNKPGGGNVKDQCHLKSLGLVGVLICFLPILVPFFFFFLLFSSLRKNLPISSLENKAYRVAMIRRTLYFAWSVNLKCSGFKSLKLFLLRGLTLLVVSSCDLQNTLSVTTVTGNPQEVNWIRLDYLPHQPSIKEGRKL